MSDTTIARRVLPRAEPAAAAGPIVVSARRRRRGLGSAYFWTTLLPGVLSAVYLMTREEPFFDALHEQMMLVRESLMEWVSEERGSPDGLGAADAADLFVLNGIVWSDDRPVALINHRAFETGQAFFLEVADQRHLVHCLEIGPREVRIRLISGAERTLSVKRS